MKDKIEITQADLLKLLSEKVRFLMNEYSSLHDSFEYKGRGKVKTDVLKISDSNRRFLKEEGDIRRILNMYELFNDTTTKQPSK